MTDSPYLILSGIFLDSFVGAVCLGLVLVALSAVWVMCVCVCGGVSDIVSGWVLILVQTLCLGGLISTLALQILGCTLLAKVLNKMFVLWLD